MFKKFAIIIITLIFSTSCTKQDFGMGLGAIGGAAIGSTIGKGDGRMAAIALGSIFGAAVGGAIGKSMDETDKMYYNQSSQQAFESARIGQVTSWKNPDSGNYGDIIINKTYKTSKGVYCRDFVQTISIDGTLREGYGTACRQANGQWHIIMKTAGNGDI